MKAPMKRFNVLNFPFLRRACLGFVFLLCCAAAALAWFAPPQSAFAFLTSGENSNATVSAISPPNFNNSGGSGTISVTAQDAWMAQSNDPWIIVQTASGTGNGIVSYTVAPNDTGEPRTGSITVAGQIFDDIFQAGYGRSIAGKVVYGINNTKNVYGVTLTTTGGSDFETATSLSGAYLIPGLIDEENYTVTPSKTTEVKGINSLDAARILQHLDGLITLTPNQLIAADTDGNGTVNSTDATRIQQRAVGITAQNIIGQWKFVPGSKQYNNITTDPTGQNFEAVLVGEVSGNWATAESFANDYLLDEEILPKQANQVDTAERFENELAQQTPERMKQSAVLKADKSQPDDLQSESAILGSSVNVTLPANAKASTASTITIPVTVEADPSGTSIESFDFTVFYDPTVLQPASPVDSNSGTLSANCSLLANSPVSGRMIVSGACAKAVTTASGGVLYNLQFTVIGAVNQTTALTFVSSPNNTYTFQFNDGTPSAITNTGQFTVLAPTAAPVSISGRVTNNQGRGIRNVTITLTNSNGNSRTVQTTSFGYYRFDDVAAGETVTITAKARRFKFVQSSIVRTTNESITDADFVSEQ